MEKSALVLLAQGCEELEAVTIIDLLRRAKVRVVTAGLNAQPVTASRGTKLIPDTSLDKALKEPFDMLVLPGGMPGTEYLGNDARVLDLARDMFQTGKWVCAICAAPMVLAKAGVLAGKRATGYPGTLEGLKLPDVTITGEAVTRDGNIVTSRGPGTAMDFALTLIEVLLDRAARDQVEKSLVR